MKLDIFWEYKRLDDSVSAWVYVYHYGEIKIASHAGYHDGEFAAERACINNASVIARVVRLCGAIATVRKL